MQKHFFLITVVFEPMCVLLHYIHQDLHRWKEIVQKLFRREQECIFFLFGQVKKETMRSQIQIPTEAKILSDFFPSILCSTGQNYLIHVTGGRWHASHEISQCVRKLAQTSQLSLKKKKKASFKEKEGNGCFSHLHQGE